MSENATCCSCGKSGINPDKHRCIPELKEELNEWQRQVCGQGEVISLLNDKLFTANATIAAFNAKVIHCEKCGSSWYDDGFTPSCPSCTIAALKAENEMLKAILDRVISHIDKTARGPYYIAIPRLYGELGRIIRGEEP